MPGRQAHGRPVSNTPKEGNKKKPQRSKARGKQNALNAFSIASEAVGDTRKLTPRYRELESDFGGGKRSRSDEEDEDDDEEDEAGPPKKMRKATRDEDDDVEYGSDSSGNEWRVGVDEDDSSEIDSDDAFGASDEERFQGYAFGGSKKKQEQESEDDEADGASLGSDAIDLAAALDMSMSEDEAAEGEGDEDEDEDEDDSDEDSTSDEDESSRSSAEDEEDDISETGVKNWVSKFSGVPDKDEQELAPKKSKIDLKDLGLFGIKDASLKKSLKLMSKEEKTGKQKLEVPLARRAQGRLDRSTAYEQTNKTLQRWQETVKQNRRSEHLVFPLPQTETGISLHDNSEIAPLERQGPETELERTIFGIMEESGLGPGAEKSSEDQVGEDGQLVSKKDLQNLWQAKRREREVKTREDARAKRIRKIKSKAYHRVHRKERERNERMELEARVEAGEVDSEDEREAQDRLRATERMGARHRESKWAKMTNKAGRAGWDADVRQGITEMARRNEELRRRVEGKSSREDDDDESDFSGDSNDVDDRKALLKELQDISDEEEAPKGLMAMKFMMKAEAAKKKANDDLISEIRRELASDGEEVDSSDPEELEDIGRKSFGLADTKKHGISANAKKEKPKHDALQETAETAALNKANNPNPLSVPAPREEPPNSTAGAWSATAPSRLSRKQKGKKAADSSANVLDLDSSVVAVQAPKPKPAKKQRVVTEEDSSDDDQNHMPIQFNEQDLLDKAFGGMDVLAEFEEEKNALAEAEDDQIKDDTLPGWGQWVGEGVRQRKRHQFLTKQEGVKKKDRKDAKLQNVIINEKRIKKNAKYLASQLPHPYESAAQYERALRLPIGPEWVTKQTFQEATKPRVIVKQGIIAPMAKPLH